MSATYPLDEPPPPYPGQDDLLHPSLQQSPHQSLDSPPAYQIVAESSFNARESNSKLTDSRYVLYAIHSYQLQYSYAMYIEL